MSDESMFPAPFVEAFLMAEDIRNEQNGQVSLVGLFSDCLFARGWPLRFPKLCYMVRVRGLKDKCAHSLVLSKIDDDAPIARLTGPLDKLAENSELAIFTYMFIGLEFDQPGCFLAKFSASEEDRLLVSSHYSFKLLVPNPDELYVECTKCHIKYGSGVVTKGPLHATGCQSVCPQCKNSNPFDSDKAFRFPAPPYARPRGGVATR